MSKFGSAIASACFAALTSGAHASEGLDFESGDRSNFYLYGSGSSHLSEASEYAISYTQSENGVDYQTTVTAAAGRSFGLLSYLFTPNTFAELTYTFAAPTTTLGTLYFRFVTPDGPMAEGANDFASVFITGLNQSDYLPLNGQDIAPDSGWISMSVGIGTTAISLSLYNALDARNPPLLFIDYAEGTPTPAVPEPAGIALTLAGLAAIGLSTRRRQR